MKKLIMNLQLFAEGEEDFDFDFEPSDFGYDDEGTPTDTDTEVEEQTEVDTNEEVQEEQEQTQEEVQQEIQKLKLKYNHQEMELPIDEVTALAQKGMNYDKLQSRLSEVENNVGLRYLQEIAEKNGTSIDEMVNYWKEQEKQQELNELIQNNIPQELAQEILENRRYRQEQQKLYEQNRAKEMEKQEFQEFLSEFPNADIQNIPKEVWEKNSNGIPLKYAYMEYEHKRLANEVNILKNNEKNRGKSPVKGIGNAIEEIEDDFMQGFNSF